MKINPSLLFSAWLCAGSASAAETPQAVPGQAVSGSVRRAGYRNLQRLLPRLELLQADIEQARLSELKAWPLCFAAYKATSVEASRDYRDWSYWSPRMTLQPVLAVKRDELFIYHDEAVKAVSRSVGAMDRLVKLLQEESRNAGYNPAEQAVLAGQALGIAAAYQQRGDAAQAVLKAQLESLTRTAEIRTDKAEISNPSALADLMNNTSALLKADLESAGKVIADIRELNEVYGDYGELMEDVRDPLHITYVYFGGADDRAWGVDKGLSIDLVAFYSARVVDETLKRRLLAEAGKSADEGAVAGILYNWGGTSPRLVTPEEAQDFDTVLGIVVDMDRRQ